MNLSSISPIYCCFSRTSSSLSSSILVRLALLLHKFSTFSSIKSIKKGFWEVCVPLSIGCDGFLVTNWDILALQCEQVVASLNYIEEPSDLSSFPFWSVPYSTWSIYYFRIPLPLLLSLLLISGIIIFPRSLFFENIIILMIIKYQATFRFCCEKSSNILFWHKWSFKKHLILFPFFASLIIIKKWVKKSR